VLQTSVNILQNASEGIHYQHFGSCVSKYIHCFRIKLIWNG